MAIFTLSVRYTPISKPNLCRFNPIGSLAPPPAALIYLHPNSLSDCTCLYSLKVWAVIPKLLNIIKACASTSIRETGLFTGRV